MLRTFGHPVAICCDMLGVVASSLKLVQFEPTTPNMSQHGGQTHATCCARQCCDMLRWDVAIVWPGLQTEFEVICIYDFSLPTLSRFLSFPEKHTCRFMAA